MNVAVPSARPAQGTITEHTVAALPAGKDTVVWDRALTGFGVRVYPSGAKVYVAQARGPEGSKRITVGRHGVIGASEARRRATLVLARIRAGENPVAEAPEPESVTVATLAQRYLREHVAVRCKPTTAAQYRLAIERYIVPALGTCPVSSLARSQVANLQHALSDRPAMANQVVAMLSRMIDHAMAWGVAGEISNPCRTVPKYRTRRRERFLTDAEFQRLGRVLDEMEAEGRLSVYAGAALRLLMLTGCRRNEILTLRWEDERLEAQELRLRDSKTGPRAVSPLARGGPGSGWHRQGARQPLGDPRRQSGAAPLQPVRALAPGAAPAPSRRRAMHDLRHSYASRALALGEEPAGDREAPRPCPNPDHRPLHTSHPRRRQGRSRTSGPGDCRGYPSGQEPPMSAGSHAPEWECNPA